MDAKKSGEWKDMKMNEEGGKNSCLEELSMSFYG